jgi:arginyl-tRNA synthetase
VEVLHIEKQLIALLQKIIHESYGLPSFEIKLEQTKPEFEGDYTLVVFPLLKYSKKSAETTADEIGQELLHAEHLVSSFQVVKGFLNISVNQSLWLSFIDTTVLDSFSAKHSFNGNTIMVEYSSPNTNKPLHLGHIRNNLLGYSLSQLLAFAGNKVYKVNLINDRGIHICKSMLAWMKFGNNETPESSGKKGDHLVGKYYVEFDKAYKNELAELKVRGISEADAEKQSVLMEEARELLINWEAGDPKTIEVWRMMNNWVYAGFEKTYKRLGVSFDKYYYESDTYLLGKEEVAAGLASGIFYKSDDGSVWIDLEEEGLDKKLLLRSDGTSVYVTQDLGTAQMKYEDFGMNQSIYVVGNEQDYHFKVLFSICKKMNKPYADKMVHLSYGMVDLPSGKMKSREGTVVDADDLMDTMQATAAEITAALGKTEGMDEQELNLLHEQIGLGALKYYLLKVDPGKRILFNPQESIDFQGNTGSFLQYTFARISSLLRQTETPSCLTKTDLLPQEKDLAKEIYRFNAVLLNAAQALSPALIANYTYDLVKSYNRFYHDLPVLKEADEAKKTLRIVLNLATKKRLSSCFDILGIPQIERM